MTKDDLYSIINNVYETYETSNKNFSNYFSKPIVPNFDSLFASLYSLAEEEDDFEKIFNQWKNTAQKAAEHGKLNLAIRALKTTHLTYVNTQKLLASVNAKAGNFDDVFDHLSNAHVQTKVKIPGRKTIKLELLIANEEAQEIMGQIEKKASTYPLDYFLRKIVSAANEGEITKVSQYNSLLLKCLERKGKIKHLDPFEQQRMGPIDQPKFGRLLTIQKKLREYHLKAYDQKIGKLIEEAIGYAVKSNIAFFYKKDIEKRLEEVKELAIESVERFAPNKTAEYSPLKTMVNFFNTTLNPFFDLLLACDADSEHPLRSLVEPVFGGKYGLEVVDIRYKRDQSTEKPSTMTTALTVRQPPIHLDLTKKY